MTDESYIKKTIEQLKREKAEHEQKFAGNQAHVGCAPNFDRAIQNLENEEYRVVGRGGSKVATNSAEEVTKNKDIPKADEPADYTEAGDIGDEQMPAGEIKTDKKAWNYDASKNIKGDFPQKVKDFMAGL